MLMASNTQTKKNADKAKEKQLRIQISMQYALVALASYSNFQLMFHQLAFYLLYCHYYLSVRFFKCSENLSQYQSGGIQYVSETKLRHSVCK